MARPTIATTPGGHPRPRRSSWCRASAPVARRWNGSTDAAWPSPSGTRSRMAPGTWASASGCSCCSIAPTRTTPGCWVSSRVTWWPSAMRPACPTSAGTSWRSCDHTRCSTGVADGAPAYFVHSYVARPADASIVITETEHGSRFPSVIVADRIIGFQPHPERSGERRSAAAGQHAGTHRVWCPTPRRAVARGTASRGRR